MDEITMLAELKPEAPARADQLCEAARARLTAEIGAEIGAEQGRRRTGTMGLPALGRLLADGRTGRRWRAVAAVGVAAAAATVAVVLSRGGTPAAHKIQAARPGSIVTAGWVVRLQSDGIVTLTLKELHVTDPAALQRALRAEGIPSIFLATPPEKSLTVDGVTVHYQACSYRLDTAPANVQQAVVRQLPLANTRDKQDLAWSIDPSAMPPGSTLLPVPSNGGPLVLKSQRPPACVPVSPSAVRHGAATKLNGLQKRPKHA